MNTQASVVRTVGADTNALSILRFDGTTGAFLDTFVAPGAGRLGYPIGIRFGPDGNLYVASQDVIGTDGFNNKINRYDGQTGALIGDFVAARTGGPGTFRFITFGPPTGLGDGNPNVVPEPGTGALLAGAVLPLLGLALRQRRKTRPR